jgi:DNA repair exonuclease SbcCD nuclease subunit
MSIVWPHSNLLLIGDLHIGDLHPECRTDNYLDSLLRKLQFIDNLHANVHCYAGDIVDHWKQSPEVINRVLSTLRFGRKRFVIPGQHDLPNHNPELIGKSAFQTFVEAGQFQVLGETPVNFAGIDFYGAGWGSPWPNPRKGYSMLLTHIETWLTAYRPGEADGHALNLLKKSKFNLILTGDNHQTFTAEHEGRHLINCGSLMRKTADQITHRPVVYQVNLDPLQINPVYVPIEEGVVVRSHIEKKDEHEKRLTAFVSKLKEGGEVSLSFKENIEALLSGVEQEVVNEVRQAIGE